MSANLSKKRKRTAKTDVPFGTSQDYERLLIYAKNDRFNAFTLIDPKNGREYPVNPNRVYAVTQDTLPQYLKESRIIFPGDYVFLKISKPQMRYFQDKDEAKVLKKTGSASGISATMTQLSPPEAGMTKEGTADL